MALYPSLSSIHQDNDWIKQKLMFFLLLSFTLRLPFALSEQNLTQQMPLICV